MRAGDDAIVAHAGTRVLGDLADRVGLAARLSHALAGLKQRRRGHDRGRVFLQLALAIADGATRLSDIAVLRHQPASFGAAASVPTVRRTLTACPDTALTAIAAAHAAARRRVWAAGLDPGLYVIDLDGTLVIAHSDKEGAAPIYKQGDGFYPAGPSGCHGGAPGRAPATGQHRVGHGRRPHPGPGRRAGATPGRPPIPDIIVSADSAGCSHAFLQHGAAQGLGFIVGFPLTLQLAATVIGRRRLRGIPAITADGTAKRAVGTGAEVTPYVDLSSWPPGSRLIVRREILHPGAPLTFTDVHGYRYPFCLTTLPDPDIAFLEALYRGRGRCEQVIRDLTDTGLAHLPSADFATNQAWLTAVLIAGDLLSWFRGVCLTGSLAAHDPRRHRPHLGSSRQQENDPTGRRLGCTLKPVG